MCVTELRVFGSDEEVTVESKFESAGDGHSIDGTNEWLVEIGEWSANTSGVLATVGARAAEVSGGIAEFLEVKTGTECRVGSGENDYVDGVVVVGI